MNFNTQCHTAWFTYVEVSCYICDGKVELAGEILQNLDQNELKILLLLKKEVQGLPLGEFFVHSPDKTWDGVINYIKSLGFIDFMYIFHAESIAKENIDPAKEVLKSDDLTSLFSMMDKVKEYVEQNCHDEEYRNKLYTLYNGLKKYPPLEYCQNLMGKRFARVSDYKKFFFVPVKYLVSYSACRIFSAAEILQMIPLSDQKNQFTDDEIYESLKVIADKTRLEIIKIIKDKSCYGKELADMLNMKPPTISHHIEQLNKIGLIHQEQLRNTKYFSLNRIRFRELLSSLENFL